MRSSASVLIMLLTVCILSGCRSTKVIPEERIVYKTDTLWRTEVRKDSVYIENTDTFLIKGDTVREIRWRTRYVTKMLTDTLYRTRTDSVTVTRRVEVEKSLTRWQKVKMKVGGYSLFTVLLALLAGGIYIVRKLTRP